MPNLKRTLIVICLPFMAWAVAFAEAADTPVAAVAPQPASPTAAKDAEDHALDEIVVTGLRASLEVPRH